jgi:PAS domain S-box-containing protein
MKSGFWNDLNLGRKGLITALFPSVSLLIGFIAMYELSAAERRAQTWVWHSLEVRHEIARALTALAAEESSTRGFALTKNDEFRAAVFAARDDVVNALTRIARDVADNGSQQDRLNSIRSTVSDCHRLNEELLTSKGNGAPELVAAERLQTESARKALLEMESEEMSVHVRRTTRLEQIRDVNIVATAITAAFGIVGGFVAVFLLSRSTVRRIQRIGDDAERLAAGLPIREKDAGRDEIGRVNEQLQATSTLLAARTNALRESEARLQSIMDNTSSIIFMKDLQGRFLMANAQFERVFGLKRESFIGQDVHSFFPAEFADVYRENEEQALASPAPLQFEEVTPHSDGMHTYLSIKFALRDSKGVPYAVCGISTDITDRKRAEEVLRQSHDQLEKHVQERTIELQDSNAKLREEVVQHRETAETLKRTNAQLLQAQKMEALGQIAGGIAHDFNNILTTIMGYGMLLLQQVPEEERDKSPVAEILRASERAGSLSKQLLSFSRPQATDPLVLNLNAVVENTEKMLLQAIGGRIILTKSLDPELGQVRMDQSQIEQLLLNFVINARDAIKAQGEIEIKTENVSLEADEIKRDIAAKDFACLTIRDTGEGIPPEMMGRIFEPFFTTKRPGQGTGLGLATCSAIVQQSGGWIACQSQPGKGTRFTVFLPRVEEEAENLNSPTRNGALPGGRETVLVVEDEPSVGNLFECLLRKLGYEVLRAEHGEEAERAIASRKDSPIDLVLTDLDMPRMDGTELVRRLARSNEGLKVILTSGNGEHFHREDDSIDCEFLPKPFSMQTLAAKVREVLDR